MALNLGTLPLLQVCQCIFAQFGIFATLKKKQQKTKQKNPEENVFSLYEFKFLFLVWTFQFKLFESVISTD